METLLDPQLWSHPGHGEPYGMVALALLLVIGCLSLTSSAKARLRPVVLRTVSKTSPPR